MPKRVLNVGGNNRSIPLPDYYAGWEQLLLDIDPAGEPDICIDAREMTSLPAATFDAVYCSHNLEHFYPHDVPKVLAGFVHILNATGFCEIRVPDIGALMQTVVARQLDIEDTVYTAPVGPVSVRDMLYGYGRQIEESGEDFFAHKTGFTRPSLTRALQAAGFYMVVAGATPKVLELGAIAFKSAPTEEQKRRFNFAI